MPLLSYVLTTNPNPLQISPESGTIATGALTIVISNPSTTTPVYCNEIEFTLPLGTSAQDLTNNAGSIIAEISGGPGGDDGSSGWSIVGGSSNDGIYTATPNPPANNEFTNQGLVVTFNNVQVNEEIGTVTLTVDETSSTTNSDFAVTEESIPFAKFPYGFFLDSFAPIAAQITDGGSATLNWNASDGPTYTLYWGSNVIDVTDVRTYTTGPLDSDTTFLLQASQASGGETVLTSVTTSVNISDPELTVTSLTVNSAGSLVADGSATFNGTLTASGVTTLNGAVTASSSATFNGSLTATGTTLFSGTVSAFGSLQTLDVGTFSTPNGGSSVAAATYDVTSDGLVIGVVSSSTTSGFYIGTAWIYGTNDNNGLTLAATGGVTMGYVDLATSVAWQVNNNQSFTLPVGAGQSFTIQAGYFSQNDVANNPIVLFYFVPIGQGGAANSPVTPARRRDRDSPPLQESHARKG